MAVKPETITLNATTAAVVSPRSNCETSTRGLDVALAEV
jgi:hypothetical protein